MQLTYASEPAPGAVNEDVIVAGPSFVAVLDGATAAPGVDSGCRHDVAWYARHLSGQLALRLYRSAAALPELLAESIAAVMAEHADTCDLSNPDSPSATAAILRRCGTGFEYLVLADSPILLDDGSLHVIVDDRLDRLLDYSIAGVSRSRNADGGFWVASTDPAAADHAVTGTVDSVRRAAVMSDGAARLVERFDELSWPELLDALQSQGPREVISRTRKAEEVAPARRGKRFDDATAAFVLC
jgi:hypothetical protein